MEMNIIHIVWEGPFTLEYVRSNFNIEDDFGIYQVYGNHVIYGDNVLLYIGKTDTTFGKRFVLEPNWKYNSGDVSIYIGRLGEYKTRSPIEIKNNIKLVEQLFIYSHQPAMNSSCLNIKPSDLIIEPIHVINWGHFRDLLPEISCAKYSNCYHSDEGYHSYKKLINNKQ